MIVNRFDYDKKRNTRSSRAGSRLFPLEKGAKELFARHFGSLLFISHVGTRSASLPKLAVLVQQAHTHRRFKHMERLVFCCCACYGYAQQQKIPSRATQSDSAGAALAYRKLFKAQSIFNANLFCETNLCTQDVVTQPMVKISKQFSR